MRKTNRSTVAKQDELKTRMLNAPKKAWKEATTLYTVSVPMFLVTLTFSIAAIVITLLNMNELRQIPEAAHLVEEWTPFIPIGIMFIVVFPVVSFLTLLVIGSHKEELEELVDTQNKYFYDN